MLVPVVIVLVGAWVYRWVDEDAFINFRIIDNLLAGHGLVFNLGERVEVDSDPLWLFTLTGLHEVASLRGPGVAVGDPRAGLHRGRVPHRRSGHPTPGGSHARRHRCSRSAC